MNVAAVVLRKSQKAGRIKRNDGGDWRKPFRSFSSSVHVFKKHTDSTNKSNAVI